MENRGIENVSLMMREGSRKDSMESLTVEMSRARGGGIG